MHNNYERLNEEPETPYSQDFWDNYALFLLKQGISKKYIVWYVLRTKQYIAAYPEHPVRSHQPQQVEEYLNSIGRKARLKNYQFIQIIHAIQLLFSLGLKTDWAADFDWEYWKTAAKTLESSHATVARDYDNGLQGLSLPEPKPYNHALREKYQPALAEVVQHVRDRNYAMKTEKTYRGWIARFFFFHQPDDVKTLGTAEVKQYLEYLVLQRNVSVSTQKQALNALAFLFNKVWEKPLGNLGAFAESKRPRRLPVVLSKDEVKAILNHLNEKHQLMAGLMYGGGMRLMECVNLRTQDIDFDYKQIIIRNGKGFKDRIVPLPVKYTDALQQQIEFVRFKKHPTKSPAQMNEQGFPAKLSRMRLSLQIE